MDFQLTGAFEEIYMAHSTWFSYTATLRIFKHYDFNLKDKATASKSLSFSSYPGKFLVYVIIIINT